jgi:hypothetical protein
MRNLPSSETAPDPDPTHLNIKDDREVRHWAEKFGCTVEQLKQAAKKVGSHIPAIRAELGRKVPL